MRSSWPIAAGLIIIAPLIGAVLIGRPLPPLFRFSLQPTPAVHEPFSWVMFGVYAGLAGGILILLFMAASRPVVTEQTASRSNRQPFPIWAWSGLAGLGFFWALAWSRWEWAAWCQPYTFTPLWLLYIVVVNGVIFRRSGTSPLTDHPQLLLILFPVSSIFWWFFEYVNQFVQNWWYSGVPFSPVAYRIHATIAFSTVLPAVYSTRCWIMGAPWFYRRFYQLAPLRVRWPKWFAVAALVLALAGMAAMPQWPDQVFSWFG